MAQGINITSTTHPVLFMACNSILVSMAHDQKGSDDNIELPLAVPSFLANTAEHALRTLTARDFALFVSGTDLEIQDIATRNFELAVAGCVLNAFFHEIPRG